jgi:hypothetical protein
MTAAPNAKVTLQPVRQQLAQGPYSEEQLRSDHAHRWQALGWGPEQIRLWLRCQPGVSVDETDPSQLVFRPSADARPTTPSLADQIVDLLGAAAKPVPIAQLMKRLPAGANVTEPMLRAAVSADPRLQLTGPLVKLA